MALVTAVIAVGVIIGFSRFEQVVRARSGSANEASASMLMTYDIAPAGNDRNRLKLHVNGGNLELLDSSDQSVLTSRPVGNISGVVINGSASDDTLVVDLTNGNPIPAGGLTFNGNDQVTGKGDIVEIEGGSFHTAVYTYYNGHDGNISLDGSIINYTGLEPIVNSGTAADIVFNLPAGTVFASLEDDGTLTNNKARLVSNDATPTFENTVFTNPTNSLTINAGAGTTSIGTAPNFCGGGEFKASLILNGKLATDTINLDTLTLGNAGGNPGNLTVTGKDISVHGPIDTTAGTSGTVTFNLKTTLTQSLAGTINAKNININASGDVTVGQMTASSNLSIMSTAGSVLDDGDSSTILKAPGISLTTATGAFGTTAATPLDIDATTLSATAIGGPLNVRDTAGGLAVTLATASGPVTLEAAGASADLTLAQVIGTTAILKAAGAVNGTPGLPADVSATNLLIISTAGIGVSMPLETAVSNLDFNNSTSGIVSILNTGPLTIANVASAGPAVNNGNNTLLVTTAGSLTIANNISSPASITALASESAGINDDLTVNSGITVSSSNGGVQLEAGDTVNLLPGSVVQALTSPNVAELNGGFADTDGIKNVNIRGALNASGNGTSAGVNTSMGNLLIDFTAGASLPNGLYSNVPGTVTINDLGGASAHTYIIASGPPLSIKRDAAVFNLFGLPTSLAISGGNLSDTFNITPLANTLISVSGGNPTPPATPGDALNINTAGVTNLGLTVSSDANGFQGAYTFGNRQQVTFNGMETLSPAAPTLSINNVALTEGNSGSTNAVFTLTLSAPATLPITVDYFTSNGTATSASDYQSGTGTVTFPAGVGTRTISVPVNGDLTPEGNETFFVNLTNATNATLAAAKGTGTINDDDATSIFQFSSATASVAENAVPGSATVTVTRTGDLTGAASVRFETSDGSAQQRSDYTFGSGLVQFGPGESSKDVNILITNDVYVEGAETFLVTLSSPSGNCAVGSPNSIVVTITDDDVVLGTNPIDNAGFFVRQQYLDFLGREPDPVGLNFWTTNITSCGADAACVASKRIDTSAAFFLSIEFQETSGNVLRTQRVAFGKQSNDPLNRVPYLQFMRDTRQVGQGVVVGQAGFDTLLEMNKQTYAEQVVLDPNFTLRFPPAPGPVYVDALFASAGATPTAAERAAAINAFMAGGTTGRIAALRSVVDSNSVRQTDFNPSFVLAQYYGYLRRNPTDAPDFSDAGYQFWLTKLNSFSGDFRAADMVKSFILSTEYRQRFGQ